MRTGPLALLPLWGNYSSIVWSCPPDIAKELTELSEDRFIERLNSALHKTSDYGIGALPDAILPDFLKRKHFEKPPIIERVDSKRF